MPPEKKSTTQKKYLAIQALNSLGVNATPEELAADMDRNPSDFEVLMTAKYSPDLANLTNSREKRQISIAGMSDNGNDLIGFALILQDLKNLFKWKPNK